MKRLIWKELVELRYVPVTYAFLLTCILCLWCVMGNWVALHGGSITGDRLNFNNALTALGWGFVIAGLIPGSNAIAGEAIQGTLEFLSSIPARRIRVWIAKITAGLVTTLKADAAMSLVVLVPACIMFRREFWSWLGGQVYKGHVTPESVLLFLLYAAVRALLASLYVYSISLFSSTVTERPLSAAGLAIILALGISAVLMAISGINEITFGCCLAASIPGFFLASWAAFTIKGSLSISRRRTVATRVILLWLAGVAVTGVCWRQRL